MGGGERPFLRPAVSDLAVLAVRKLCDRLHVAIMASYIVCKIIEVRRANVSHCIKCPKGVVGFSLLA